MSKLRRRAAGLGAALLLVLAGASLGQERGFYAGYTASAEQFDATFSKSVDNTDPDTLVPEPRRGMVFHDTSSADTVDLAVGFLAGYRAPLSDGGAYLSTEIDVTFHGGEPDGQLAGVGVSPERKQLGESWPDTWSVDKKRSYGLTLRLGFQPDSLQSRGMSLYLLGGVRLRPGGDLGKPGRDLEEAFRHHCDPHRTSNAVALPGVGIPRHPRLHCLADRLIVRAQLRVPLP